MPVPPKRTLIAILASTLLCFLLYLALNPSAPGLPTTTPHPKPHSAATTTPDLHGHAIASKLGNATKKAELGNHAWYLFHTTFASFPDTPSAEESAALKAYIHLFQRLYPCGECAQHFGTVLEKFPPQVSSRSAAAAWGCHVHNEVNRSLGKGTWDCARIGEFYDCGCAEGEEEGEDGGEEEAKERSTGARGRDLDVEVLGDGGRRLRRWGAVGRGWWLRG